MTTTSTVNVEHTRQLAVLLRDLHTTHELHKWAYGGVCHIHALARVAAEYATDEHRKDRRRVPFGQGSPLRKAYQVILDEYHVPTAAQSVAWQLFEYATARIAQLLKPQ